MTQNSLSLLLHISVCVGGVVVVVDYGVYWAGAGGDGGGDILLLHHGLLSSLSSSSVTRAGSRSGGCDITGDCVCDMAFFWTNKNCYPCQPSPPCYKCYLNRSEICKQVSKSLLPVEFCLLAVINTTWGRDPAQIDPTVIQCIIDSQYLLLSIE